MKPSLNQIAAIVGVSVKTVSNALSGGPARMAEETRARIVATAERLGYVPNAAAQAMRHGYLPIIGIVADGLITAPFATEITRALDNTLRPHSLTVMVTEIGSRSADAGVAELERFMPRAIAYAAMYHKRVQPTPRMRAAVRLLVNCRDDADDGLPGLVPAEAAAAEQLLAHLFARGRRRLAFLNLPGLLAGELRAEGFRRAHERAGVALREDWIRPATRGVYSDRARSLVDAHLRELMTQRPAPDAIVCGNDRVAMEAMGALRRLGVAIPGDVAVAGFDNQIEIAARLDPPLTTMALPHRAMGRMAAEILLGQRAPPDRLEEIPFRLVERAST